MEVISLKTTKKLVKNATYQVASFNNSNTKGYSYFKPVIRIFLTENSIQSFPLESFKPTIGDSFPQINYISPEYRILLDEREQMKIDKNLKTGDYVVPIHDGLKTLLKGKKYKVKEVKLNDHKNSSGQISWTDIKIKLHGSERLYTSWNFRKCTNQEVRDLGLKSLFDEETDVETVNKFKRKFDYYSEDEKTSILLESIISAANDRYRNQMGIVDWAIEKTGEKYSLIKSDFDSIKSLSLEQILNILK